MAAAATSAAIAAAAAAAEAAKDGDRRTRVDMIKASTGDGKKSSGPLMGRSSRGLKRTDGIIRFKTNFRNTIYLALKNRPGWKITEHELEWDFHWCERDWMYEVFDHVHLDNWQRVNHFRNGRELCRKDLLIKNVKRMKRSLDKDKSHEAAKYDFCPTTFVLPGDYALFKEEFKRSQGSSSEAWIMKPVGKSQGKGIFLFTKLQDINGWKTDYRFKEENKQIEAYVVQRYIANPYLVGGKKFDMRLYALVTSYQPLVMYQYRSGFCRFTNKRYTTGDMANLFSHLTNVAVQKTSDTYNKDTGGKWDLNKIKMHIMSRHGREACEKLFTEITSIMVKAVLSVQPVIMSDKHCFELYGYDIMFDDNLKPWLLEVNASPSLTANTKQDEDLTVRMLTELLDIIDIEGKKEEGEDPTSHGGFQLIYNGDPIPWDPHCIYGTSLGYELPLKEAPKKAKKTSLAGDGLAPSGASSSDKKESGSASAGMPSEEAATSKRTPPPRTRPTKKAPAGDRGGVGDAKPSDYHSYY